MPPCICTVLERSRIQVTDISVVLDRSGSMESVRLDTIGGFNTFLKAQQETPGEALLTLAQFDDQYEIVHQGVNIQEVPPLTESTFVPRGMTALLDAIGRTINATGARIAALDEAQRPGKVIFVILTDGEENSSQEFTKKQINKMISHQKKAYNWEFVFLGAKQDAIRTGHGLGIRAANSMTYAANSRGTDAAFRSMSCSLSFLRNANPAEVKERDFFSEDDRQQQKDAGADEY